MPVTNSDMQLVPLLLEILKLVSKSLGSRDGGLAHLSQLRDRNLTLIKRLKIATSQSQELQ